MGNIEAIPQKSFYKTSEVCQFTDTQPYVLRFWESEFPQLSPERSSGGQSVYRREDIDLVLRIKQLLYEEEYTIAGARKQLDRELIAEPGLPDSSGQRRTSVAVSPDIEHAHEPTLEAAPRIASRTSDGFETVSRERYEDAVDEVAHLRLKLKEEEGLVRKAEAAQRKAEETAQRQRERTEAAISRLEHLLARLD